MPIRKLMALAGGLIQRIKPCFMLSPLSIAQFLDPRVTKFDVVVFDEASQVHPADALGAMLRAGQIVAMGDTHQLPPTTFFDYLVDARDEYDEEAATTVTDIESILHLCKRSFPSKTLRWHYRSRHESLIAVSNQEFYDNRLLFYPSPIDEIDRLGLAFVHLPETQYDRGRSATNREEARAVVAAAFDQYRRFPERSVGIGTFNIKQQEAILEEVERQLRAQPDMEPFFAPNRHEHFFVKNIETIQGDERDTILISIGYGRDSAGKLTHNFGPLNHKGGERRLNVLITRAREQCIVFSNFRGDDLRVDAATPAGVAALKAFLDFAEHRMLRRTAESPDERETPFHDEISAFLREHGHEVRTRVGCAGFRVDLGVIDDRNPGRYLLGVECDGPKYHGSHVARDRDRLRRQILEKLGWQIDCVWSTDWYRSRTACEHRLLQAIAAARLDPPRPKPERKAPELVVAVPTPAPVVIEQRPDASLPPTRSLEDFADEYVRADSLGIPAGGDINDCPQDQLAAAVRTVVNVEGPIHVDEAIRRIRSLWGLARTGDKAYATILTATWAAEDRGWIERRGLFLWPGDQRPVPVRRRTDDPPPRLDLICEPEIAEAVKRVLQFQHATVADELVVQASRLLGFKLTARTTADRMHRIVDELVAGGDLVTLPNGMLALPEA
ncbi:MAG: DUF3320 domain-containing protein [Verrucomicrobia bacterium]|nr:DUF3320 domain-containing protein [Verrucomicrobiota bacterium]